VYAYVTARDVTCVAGKIDASHVCSGRVERHHAGLKIGMARITDPRHVALLCDGANQGAWARVHDREVLDHLDRVESAREKARHDFEEELR
jgi:hypothetical protein